MRQTVVMIFLIAFFLALVPRTDAQGPAPRSGAATPLKDIGDLIVGKWTGEGTYSADYPGVGKKGEKFTSTSTCRWTAGQAAITCEGRENTSTWTSLYWWDSGSKEIKVIGVNPGGNFDVGTIAKQGAKLVWASAGSFADGRRVEYKYEVTFQDNGNTRVETGATILAGVRNEFREIYKRVAK